MHINKEKIPQKHKLKGEDVDIPPLARMRVRENVQESGKMLPRVGDEVVVCGQLFHTSNRVITWLDRGGFNAYSCLPTHAASTSEAPLSMRYGCRKVNSGKKQKLCYPGQRLLLEGGAEATPTMKEVRSEEWELGMLQEAVHQLVVHYDGCGTARRCFKVTPLTPPSVERQHPKSNRWCPSNLQRCFSHGWNGVRGNVVSNL